MQGCVEWEKYQLQKCQTMLSNESQFSVKKTGAVTLMVASVASSHLTLMFLFSDELKTHAYYLFKVCQNCTFLNLNNLYFSTPFIQVYKQALQKRKSSLIRKANENFLLKEIIFFLRTFLVHNPLALKLTRP